MYVCICNGITDKDIRKAVASGAGSLGELQETLGVASQCGSCAEQAISIVAEHAPMTLVDDSLFYSLA